MHHNVKFNIRQKIRLFTEENVLMCTRKILKIWTLPHTCILNTNVTNDTVLRCYNQSM